MGQSCPPQPYCEPHPAGTGHAQSAPIRRLLVHWQRLVFVSPTLQLYQSYPKAPRRLVHPASTKYPPHRSSTNHRIRPEMAKMNGDFKKSHCASHHPHLNAVPLPQSTNLADPKMAQQLTRQTLHTTNTKKHSPATAVSSRPKAQVPRSPAPPCFHLQSLTGSACPSGATLRSPHCPLLISLTKKPPPFNLN